MFIDPEITCIVQGRRQYLAEEGEGEERQGGGVEGREIRAQFPIQLRFWKNLGS